ncbi:hypothetical protein BURKHO8Y_540008 [Burkholderia sp. 8Y]|nr:hypothetical protein BURKHO8Y_540008 [Burkholderia sp. 8Y]
MLDLLFFILRIPAFLMWAVYRMLAGIVQFFGWLSYRRNLAKEG